MAKPESAHDAILQGLLSPSEQEEHGRRVRSLVAKNELLRVIDAARVQQHITKKSVAERAGLDPSMVRRLLTADVANPTIDSAFRLLDAVAVHLEAVLPSGERVPLM
jgi:hypothetical protein